MAKFDSKKLLKTLTANQGSILVPHIDNFLINKRKEFPSTWEITIPNFKAGDGYYHPSSDCFLSSQDLWKKRKGLLLQKPINAALQKTFDCGHMWHGYLQNLLIAMNFVTEENVERKIQHTILESPEVIGSGTADLVDVDIPGHGKWLIDIKTMGKKEFDSGANEWTMLKWKAQVSCYMDWLNVDKCMILAICKDSPHIMREYQMLKDEKLLAEIYERWAYTSYCLEKDIEPDRIEQIDERLKARGDSSLDEELAAEVVAK